MEHNQSNFPFIPEFWEETAMESKSPVFEVAVVRNRDSEVNTSAYLSTKRKVHKVCCFLVCLFSLMLLWYRKTASSSSPNNSSFREVPKLSPTAGESVEAVTAKGRMSEHFLSLWSTKLKNLFIWGQKNIENPTLLI